MKKTISFLSCSIAVIAFIAWISILLFTDSASYNTVLIAAIMLFITGLTTFGVLKA